MSIIETLSHIEFQKLSIIHNKISIFKSEMLDMLIVHYNIYEREYTLREQTMDVTAFLQYNFKLDCIRMTSKKTEDYVKITLDHPKYPDNIKNAYEYITEVQEIILETFELRFYGKRCKDETTVIYILNNLNSIINKLNNFYLGFHNW